MKIAILLISAFITASASANDYIVLPESSAKELLKPCSRNAPLYEGTFTPNKVEIALLENNIIELLSLESNECCGHGKINGSISNYFRQYVGITVNSKKYIYINAGPKENSKLSSTLIFMCDGGKYYWGALYSISEKKFSHLAFNGGG
jgi:hypothetical protein